MEIERDMLENCKTLFQFAYLAKNNWNQAVEFFYHPEFKSIFQADTSQYEILYRGLSVHSGNQHNVEEFLRQTKNKEKIEYSVAQSSYHVKAEEIEQLAISIKKKGWGYIHLEVIGENNFLEIEKHVLTKEDFVKDECIVYAKIKKELLHSGRNFERILLVEDESMEITVQVDQDTMKVKRKNTPLKVKRAIVEILKSYEQIISKKTSIEEKISEINSCITVLESNHDTWLFSQLCKAHLYIYLGKLGYDFSFLDTTFFESSEENDPALYYEYAKRILNQIQYEMKKEPAKYQAYYLYLTSLYNEDAKYSIYIGKQIKKLYEKSESKFSRLQANENTGLKNATNWEVSWFYLHLAAVVYENPIKKQELLEKQFSNGCTSPIMFIEAISLWNHYPQLITKLESWQYGCLYYGIRNGLLSEELCMKVAYLAERGNISHKIVMKVLYFSYEATKNIEILSAICSLAIKTNQSETCHFKWYALGIEKELKITGLYEYYMMTLDRTQKIEIPKSVLLYFSYQNNLSYREVSYLYAYLVWKQESDQDAINQKDRLEAVPITSEISSVQAREIVHLLYDQMIAFLINQIKKGRINTELKYLYNKLITAEHVTNEIADQLFPLLFSHGIEIDDSKIKKIALVQEKMKEETLFYPVGQSVKIPLYESVNMLFWEDEIGNRETILFHYTKEEYAQLEKQVLQIQPHMQNFYAYGLYLCGKTKKKVVITKDNYTVFEYLVERNILVEWFQDEVNLQLIRYYDIFHRTNLLRNKLNNVLLANITIEEREYVLRLLLVENLHKKAYECMQIYGTENINVSVMMGIYTRMIETGDAMYVGLFSYEVMRFVKKGYYNEEILQYLVYVFDDCLEEMQYLWNVAYHFGVETYPLAKRIVQGIIKEKSSLLDEEDIVKDLINSSGSIEVICDYIYYIGYQYIRDCNQMDKFVIDQVPRVSADTIGQLSYLKYYTVHPTEQTDRIQSIILFYLSNMVQKEGIFLPFFNTYEALYGGIENYAEQSAIVYLGEPDSLVTLYYRKVQQEQPLEPFIREELREMVADIYVKMLPVYQDEMIEYYIIENTQEEEYISELIYMESSPISNSESRFLQIQNIIQEKQEGRYEEAHSLLKEYLRQIYITETIFQPL